MEGVCSKLNICWIFVVPSFGLVLSSQIKLSDIINWRKPLAKSAFIAYSITWIAYLNHSWYHKVSDSTCEISIYSLKRLVINKIKNTLVAKTSRCCGYWHEQVAELRSSCDNFACHSPQQDGVWANGSLLFNCCGAKFTFGVLVKDEAVPILSQPQQGCVLANDFSVRYMLKYTQHRIWWIVAKKPVLLLRLA